MFDVMVVDDNDLVRDTLVGVLEVQALSVRDAGSPGDALLPVPSGNRCRVLVTDVDLGPGMDGFEVARELRRLQPGLPVVFVSGRPEAFIGRIAAGDERMLNKPFAAAELVRAVRDLLPTGH